MYMLRRTTQSPPQAKLASDLVVRCVPHLAQTSPATMSPSNLIVEGYKEQTRPATLSPTELVVKRLLGTEAPCQNVVVY